jgi:hypothetical protein
LFAQRFITAPPFLSLAIVQGKTNATYNFTQMERARRCNDNHKAIAAVDLHHYSSFRDANPRLRIRQAIPFAPSKPAA